METTNHFKKQKHWIGFRRLLLIVVCMAASATLAWAGPITLNAKNRVLKEVLQEVEKQSDLSFIYSSSTINVNQKVTFSCKDVPVEVALKQLLEKEKIDFTIEGKQVLLSPSKVNAATPLKANSKTGGNQSKTVKGRVVDEKGFGVPGATVTVRGTSIGTATNIDGEFSINVPSSSSVVAVSFIGYSMMEQKVDSYQEGARMQFDLKPESKRIDEVIVTGYQTISKERATGSFAVVTTKDMEDKLQTNIISRLEGQVAGFTSYRGTKIRGVSSLYGGSPLIVVDGFPYEGSLNSINPAEITNVTLLKDAAAASIYGARSANGVIVITTRTGKVGPTRVNYTGTFHFQGLPDRGYTNLMSSSELVDFQTEMFNYYHDPYKSQDTRKSINDVYRLLYEREENKLTEEELKGQFDLLRNRDRYDQVKKEFLNSVSITQQHNLAISGGSDFYKYSLSGNYTYNQPFEKRQKTDKVGFNLKNTFNFYKWLKVDVGLLGNNSSYDYDNGFAGYSYLNGGKASYYMLRDEKGEPVQWYNSKSQYEIDRLKSIGLLDETYIPLNEVNKKHYTSRSNYTNLNIGFTFKIIEGLNLEIKGQNETDISYSKNYSTKDANSVKSMINDATVVDPTTKKITNNIPLGGQVVESRGEKRSSTIRSQLNFNKVIKDLHEIQVIAGAERRRVFSTSTGIYKIGYDDNSLGYKSINELELGKMITGTESLFGSYSYSSQETGFSEYEDRFVSFYGNASYCFNRKLTGTASIRMDQSNLWGTSSKYQYKPMWSVGAHYVLVDNTIAWLDRLTLRATYGIGGNIPKIGGPYMIAANDKRPNWYTNEFSASIISPPNSGLRWERTATTNFGFDFVLLKNRLSGSVDVYTKNTSDLLGAHKNDPLSGWDSITQNYAEMTNKGVEVNLQSENVRIGKFSWQSDFVFSYNKNELTELEDPGTSAYSYYSSAQNRENRPMGAMYSIRYAGLNEKGKPTAYTKDGKIVTSTNDLTKDDLVYSGCYNPPYSASLTNSFTYEGLDISFMFVYNGGHVMRDIAAYQYLTKFPLLNYTSNMERGFMNYWKQPGDEKDPSKNPAYLFPASSNIIDLWQYADKHIQKGDYIKLRDITVGYSLPKHLVGKSMIQNARINLQIQNVWYWAANDKNLDPETWSGLSGSRGTKTPTVYSLGVTLNL